MEFARFARGGAEMIRIVPLSRSFAAAVAMALLGANCAVAKESLVAIIEQVNAPSTELQVMDFVADGTVIKLLRGETLTVSYLRSCAIESITAGTIRIGADRSTVSEGAKIKRRFVECGIPAIVLTSRQAGQSAAVVFRKPPTLQGDLAAELTVYSTAPILTFPGPDKEVIIERLDGSSEEIYRLAASTGRIDLLATKIRLKPGGIYGASSEFGTRTFKVSPFANEKETILLRRLIPF